MSAPSGPSWPCCRSAATTRGGRWGSSSCACTSSTGSTSTARRREASSRAAAVGLRPVKDAVDRRQQARRELGGDLGGTAPCPGPARCGRVDPRRAAGACSLYVQDGKLKHHYSMLGVLEYTQESETPLPTGRGQRRGRFRRRRAQAGDGRGGDVARERRARRLGADGAHPAWTLLRLRGHGHRLRQRPRLDRSYADKAPFRFTGEIKQVTFDIAPHLARRRPGTPRARGSDPRGTRGERLKDEGARGAS